jgi:hypothetical protein
MSYDVFMRTTLTIDPDVEEKLVKRMAQKKLSLKAAVNEALRAGLSAVEGNETPKFTIEPFSLRFKPGVDTDKLNQLVDEMETEEFARKYVK